MSEILTADDRLEIHELYARDSEAFDFGDADAWAACFTPDGVFSRSSNPAAGIQGAEYQGTAELAAFAAQTHQERRAKIRHWTNNLILRPSEVGVIGTCFFMAVHVGDEGAPFIQATARYRDDLVRTTEGWRIRTRTVIADK